MAPYRKSGAEAGCVCSAALAGNACGRDAIEPRSEAAGEESQKDGARIESEPLDGLGEVGPASFMLEKAVQRARLTAEFSCDELKMSRERDAPPDEKGEALRRYGLEKTSSTTCEDSSQ